MSAKKHYCNPINVDYRYQFNADPRRSQIAICREAADPSMIYFEGKYYIFASMQLKVWVTEDFITWESYPLPENLPLYDYAPDVRVMDGYVYFCASSRDYNCDYFRTKDIIHGPYEKIEGTFPFWDPNLFQDVDGKVYFYYGCSNVTPIYGVEVDPETLKPIGETVEVIAGNPWENGYERFGPNNSLLPASEEEIDMKFQGFLKQQGITEDMMPAEVVPMIRGMFSNRPYIEGAWMTLHNGKYYLQYACPGTEFNTYGDGVYVGDHPLGPFTLAMNNPYSYKPGGYFRAAGHGSTMEDKNGNWWHTASMQISKNHPFERRVGLWKAGFDADGELYCDQRFGDWPINVETKPFEEPDWYLLSYQKPVVASSYEEGKGPERVVDETNQTWWRAASNKPGEWVCIDLEEEKEVHAIQINFADDHIDEKPAGELRGTSQPRWIDDRPHVTRWKLEGSCDKENWVVLEDKSNADSDLPHECLIWEEGKTLRYIKLTIYEIPFHQNPSISGLRVFGKGNGQKPSVPMFTVERTGDLDMKVCIEADATGYQILWGQAPDKLYHACQTFEHEQAVTALVKGRSYYVRVDAWNENGITEGPVQKVEA